MRQWKKRLAALVLAAAGLIGLCAAGAAEDQTPAAQPAVWAYDALADSYAMGLLDDSYAGYLLEPVNLDQIQAVTAVVADKLSLLELPARADTGESLVVDATRGGVMNALYQQAAAYDLPGVEEGAAGFLTGLGVVRGDGSGDLHAERICTYQEAMVMAQRLILAVYDSQDAGSRGLLWRAENGGNTLYLLGTIHADRDNLYPLHRSVRDAVAAAQEVYFELDFNDQEQLAEFAAMQAYTGGDTLAGHVSPELYRRTVAAGALLGLSEDEVSAYKPWALANTFSTLSLADESTSSNAVAMDIYLNSLAVNAGKPVAGVETYAFQGGIFDSLSPEYQEMYLDGAVTLFEAGLAGSEPTQAEQEAIQAQNRQMSAMFAAWKARDAAGFEAAYDKAAELSSGDELSSRLFTDRDPGMIQAAAALLEREGENTFFLAVGAGHMVDPGGIVSGLEALGYTVELVP